MPPAKRPRGPDGSADGLPGLGGGARGDLPQPKAPFAAMPPPAGGSQSAYPSSMSSPQDSSKPVNTAVPKYSPFQQGSLTVPSQGEYHTVAGIAAPKQPGYQGTYSVPANPLHGIQTKSSSLAIPVKGLPAVPPPNYGAPEWAPQEELDLERRQQLDQWHRQMAEQRRKDEEEMKARKLQ